MFRIAVCEDENVQVEYLKKLLGKWQEESDEKVSVDTFCSAEEFLFKVEETKPYDLLLLDIQMGKMNGIELARKIREQDKTVKIVFLTGIKDYAIEGYEVGAVRYLLKPVKEAEFFDLLDKLFAEVKEQKEEYFLFQTGGTTNRVPFSDILYVEADGHYAVIKTAENQWKWKTNFSSLSEEFETHNFFLLRRGLYVNLAQVSQIGKTECVLESGETLPVSKSRYQELNERFIAYYKGMAE